MALAFVVGLLLFAWVWSVDQGADAPETAEVAPVIAEPPVYPTLPAPQPAGTGQRPPRDEDAPQAQLVEKPPEPVVVPEPASPTPARPVAPPIAGDDGYASPRPIAGRTPPPDYPRRALRRGESGSVTIRAQIGADGVPLSVSVASSSGSRALDRAAVAAVRRWRFHPAMRNGRPTTGGIVVPINFDPR